MQGNGFSSQVAPFLRLFLDNTCTVLGVTSCLAYQAFSDPAAKALHKQYCDGRHMKSPPWPSDVTCYTEADNIEDIVHGRIVTGLAVSIVIGNCYYAWMASRLQNKKQREKEGADMGTCTLPYAINTPAAFCFAFGVVMAAGAHLVDQDVKRIEDYKHHQRIFGSDELPHKPREVVEHAWAVGCTANALAGAIAAICGLTGEYLTKVTPKATLLVALAAIGFTYLGVQQVRVAFAYGSYGLISLAVMFVLYFGGTSPRFLSPTVIVPLIAIFAGWCVTRASWPGGGPNNEKQFQESLDQFAFHSPLLFSWEAIPNALPQVLREYLPIVLPVAYISAAGTFLNIHAAAKAGDHYPIRETLCVDGLITMVGGLCGSPLGAQVHIGHPTYKKSGGRQLYSVLHAGAFCIFAIAGLFSVLHAVIPPAGIAPIILYLGMVACQDCFSVMPSHHVPAAMVGFMGMVCDWAHLVQITPDETEDGYSGINAVGHGSLLGAVVWVSLLVRLIDRRFLHAALWSLLAMVLSYVGVLHRGSVVAPFGFSFMHDKSFVHGTHGAARTAFSWGYLCLVILFVFLYCLRENWCPFVPADLIPAPDIDMEDLAPEMAIRLIGNEVDASLVIDNASAVDNSIRVYRSEDGNGTVTPIIVLKAPICECGTSFPAEYCNFCRKCGKKRPEEDHFGASFEISMQPVAPKTSHSSFSDRSSYRQDGIEIPPCSFTS